MLTKTIRRITNSIYILIKCRLRGGKEDEYADGQNDQVAPGPTEESRREDQGTDRRRNEAAGPAIGTKANTNRV